MEKREDLLKYVHLNPEHISEGMATRDEQVYDNDPTAIHSEVLDELDAEIARDPMNADWYLKKGIALSRALENQGLSTVTVPTTTLVIYLVVAAAVGVLAAIGPARRASRVDVLQAITTE